MSKIEPYISITNIYLVPLVGVGQVIKGWDEGLKGMCLYEKRKLTIPSHMAYGQCISIILLLGAILIRYILH